MENNLIEENKLLKNVIKQLRKQLDSYRKQFKKKYDLENDFVPYPEEERD